MKKKMRKKKISGEFIVFSCFFAGIHIHASQSTEQFFPDMIFLNIQVFAAVSAFLFDYFRISLLLFLPVLEEEYETEDCCYGQGDRGEFRDICA